MAKRLAETIKLRHSMYSSEYPPWPVPSAEGKLAIAVLPGRSGDEVHAESVAARQVSPLAVRRFAQAGLVLRVSAG
jgi:hypothetical protein